MLQLVCGAIIAVLTSICVEYLRRPNLKLSIENPPCETKYENRPAKNMRVVRLHLFNQPLPNWIRWMLRGPALQCRGTVTFHHLDGQNVFGRTMAIRWSGSPEPVPLQAITADGGRLQIFDPLRLTTESRIDVYPGERELLDVAVRLDEDEDCYGWNNETYFCATPWRNANWKLSRGRYLVKVTISSSGQKCVGVFRLLNDVARSDFRLEPATREDKSLVRA